MGRIELTDSHAGTEKRRSRTGSPWSTRSTTDRAHDNVRTFFQYQPQGTAADEILPRKQLSFSSQARVVAPASTVSRNARRMTPVRIRTDFSLTVRRQSSERHGWFRSTAIGIRRMTCKPWPGAHSCSMKCEPRTDPHRDSLQHPPRGSEARMLHLSLLDERYRRRGDLPASTHQVGSERFHHGAS